MNILEETPYTLNLQVTGLSMRQIKDIFEDKWGSLMWANNCAYPTSDVSLKFTNVPIKEMITMIKTSTAAYLATPPEPNFGPWVFDSHKDALKWATADCVQPLHPPATDPTNP